MRACGNLRKLPISLMILMACLSDQRSMELKMRKKNSQDTSSLNNDDVESICPSDFIHSTRNRG